jgi:hypothetical protein
MECREPAVFFDLTNHEESDQRGNENENVKFGWKNLTGWITWKN